MKVLITGGAGFIGSSVGSALIDAGHEVVVLDNLSTGRREFTAGRPFYEGEISDWEIVDQIFADHPDITTVVHCAASIVVPDSVSDPIAYYRNNVSATLELVESLVRNNCKNLVFSSSAAIYDVSEDFTVTETSALKPLSPYARTKSVVEEMLADITGGENLKVVSLRYFNPIGSDPQMRTGLQLPSPTHALGKLIQAKRENNVFTVTGTDYPTRDGSGIRDYIHVWDLADAHVRVVEQFDKVTSQDKHRVFNLGTGQGTTVRELIAAFDEVTGEVLQVQDGPRRPGDTAGSYTKAENARKELGWNPKYSVAEGIAHTLEWFEARKHILGDIDIREEPSLVDMSQHGTTTPTAG